MCRHTAEFNGLAIVLVHVFAHVAIPKGKIRVGDLNDGRVFVEGQGILNVVALCGAVCEVVNDGGAARDAAHHLVVGHNVAALFHSVEYRKITALQLVHHLRAHIGVVGEDGGGIKERRFLCDHPTFGERAVQVVQRPHAVVLNEHKVNAASFCHFAHGIGGEPLLIFYLAAVDVIMGEQGRLIFLLALLAQNQQNGFALGEALVTHECLVDEFGLARIKKACKKVYGNLSFREHSLSFPSVDTKEGFQRTIVYVCADNANASDDVSGTMAHIDLLGNVVKVDPLAVLTRNNALGAKNGAVLAAVKCLQRRLDICLLEGSGRFLAPVGEHLVGVVVMVAGAVGIVALVVVMMVVMLMMVMVVMASAVLVVMVVLVLFMLVLVMTAAFSIMIMMMFVIVVMITATFSIMIVVVFVLLMVVMMVVMMLGLLRKMLELCRQRVVLLHGVKDGLSVKSIPRCGNDGSALIVLTDKRHGGGKLFFVHACGAAENDGARVVDLVAVKFTEILHVNAALGGVGNGGEAVELDLIRKHALHRADDVGQLAHARGLDENAVGMKFIKHLAKRLGEVTHKAATDASAVHFGNLDARFLEKAAVNADLTEFVFDEHRFLARVSLF